MPEVNEELSRNLECIEQNDGRRIAAICRKLVDERLAAGLMIDIDCIVEEARSILTPKAWSNSYAQAQAPIKSRVSIIDSDDE